MMIELYTETINQLDLKIKKHLTTLKEKPKESVEDIDIMLKKADEEHAIKPHQDNRYIYIYLVVDTCMNTYIDIQT